MGSMEDFVNTQNCIREQFAVPEVTSALTMDRSMVAYANAVNQVASIQVEPAMYSFITELQKYREINETAFKSFLSVRQVLNPILEEYHRVSELVSVAQKGTRYLIVI